MDDTCTTDQYQSGVENDTRSQGERSSSNVQVRENIVLAIYH